MAERRRAFTRFAGAGREAGAGQTVVLSRSPFSFASKPKVPIGTTFGAHVPRPAAAPAAAHPARLAALRGRLEERRARSRPRARGAAGPEPEGVSYPNRLFLGSLESNLTTGWSRGGVCRRAAPCPAGARIRRSTKRLDEPPTPCAGGIAAPLTRGADSLAFFLFAPRFWARSPRWAAGTWRGRARAQRLQLGTSRCVWPGAGARASVLLG